MEGEFSSLEHLEKNFPSDGKHLSVPSSHPWSSKGQVYVNLDAQGPHPSPGILFLAFLGISSLSCYPFPGISVGCIPFVAFFSWHSQGLHASPAWHLHGLHPVLMQLKMSLLTARGWTC